MLVYLLLKLAVLTSYISLSHNASRGKLVPREFEIIERPDGFTVLLNGTEVRIMRCVLDTSLTCYIALYVYQLNM